MFERCVVEKFTDSAENDEWRQLNTFSCSLESWITKQMTNETKVSFSVDVFILNPFAHSSVLQLNGKLYREMKWSEACLAHRHRWWPCLWTKILCYCIKQIESILPYVCSVKDHIRRQNAVRTSVTHSGPPRVPLFLFLPHFDVICDL